jgi:hypothetical protein
LRVEERWASLSIAMLTLIVIAVSLLDALHLGPFAEHSEALTSVVIAFISIFILLLSIMDSNAHRELRAHRLHESGLRIGELRGELEGLIAKSSTGEDWSAVERIRTEYERELRECQFNHEPIDDRRFMIEHRTSKEFSTETGKPRISRAEALGIFARYLLSSAWVSLATWFLVIVILVASASHSPHAAEGRALMESGAWLYANSSSMMDANTSPHVSNKLGRTGQPI